jgi:hypothetical protein
MTEIRVPALVRAEHDPRLEARIVQRWSLAYEEGGCADEDRPAFARAASGVAHLAGELVLVQDDASFLARVRPGVPARAVALPRGPGGRRRFEKRLGNKNDKLDLESCVAVAGPDGARLLAFGSGSLPVRTWIACYTPSRESVRMVDAGPLYEALRAELAFSGGALNIEGAAVVQGALRLFQRSNGHHGGHPASVDLDLAAFLAWLDAGGAEPALDRITHYDLGQERGVRFGFTDACELGPDRIAYLASAEDSPDAVEDGQVLGSRVGVIDGAGARWVELRAEPGVAGALKAEGIALDPERPDRAWVVLDPDDPDRAAELCEVALGGPWST